MRTLFGRVALGLLVLVVASACSGPRRPAGAPGPAPSPVADLLDGAPCLPPDGDWGLPEESGCVSAARGTFVRGAAGQELFVYALVDDKGFPIRWRIRLIRPDGEPVDRFLNAGSETSYPRVLGAADADRDGVDEAFVKVLTHQYHSGATREIGIFGVRAGDIFRIRLDGRPSIFQVGGVSTFGEGAECRDVDLDGDAEFLLLRIDDVFGEVQRFSERVYEWRNRSLHFVRRDEGRMAKTGYHDPLLYRYYSLRCFELEPPVPYARG